MMRPELRSGSTSILRPLTAQRGFTLVELMIASLIAIIISGMMFSVFNSQERSSIRIESRALMQDQLRMALSVITRQVRMAGYGIGSELVGSVARGAPALEYCTSCGSVAGTDQLLVMYRNPLYEFRLDWARYQLDSTLSLCGTNRLYPDRPILQYPEAMDNDMRLFKDDYLACSDESVSRPRRYSIFKVSAPVLVWQRNGTPPGVINVAANAVPYTPNHCTSSTDSFPIRMICGHMTGTTLAFYVFEDTLYMDDDGDARSTGLTFPLAMPDPSTTDDIALATGIEDFQVAACVASSTDAIEVGKASASCMASPSSPNWIPAAQNSRDNTVVALRVTLVARGEADKQGSRSGSVPISVEDHAVTAPADSSPRLSQSVIIQLPNLYAVKTF